MQLRPGESLILRTYAGKVPGTSKWKYVEKYESPIKVQGEWSLHFTEGGPDMPSDQKLQQLVSWTELPDAKAISFSGTGVYNLNFVLPSKDAGEYLLDLGKVNESAHVWINGQDAGILWSIPFTARIGKY